MSDRFPTVDPPELAEQERRELARLAALELAQEPAQPVPYPADPAACRELAIQRRQEDRDREEEARWDR